MAGINFFDTRKPGDKTGLPPGGDTGQVLTKESEDDFDANWEDAPEALPSGGLKNQVLRKLSEDDFDADWSDLDFTNMLVFDVKPTGSELNEIAEYACYIRKNRIFLEMLCLLNR